MAKQNISADIIWSPGHHLATHSASLYQSAYDYRAGTNNPRTSLVCQGEVYFFFWLHVQHGLVGRCGGAGGRRCWRALPVLETQGPRVEESPPQHSHSRRGRQSEELRAAT